MQNTKIQALWHLTQELKEKRQHLIEKLSYTEDYLDQQQRQMTHELGLLKQQTHGLSSDLGELYSHLQAFYDAWQASLQAVPEPEPEPEPEWAAAPESAEHDEQAAAYQELSDAYVELSQELEEMQAAYQQRLDAADQILEHAAQALSVAQTVQREFAALRENNHQVSADLDQLKSHTDQLIELVETYRQAALEAYAQAEAAGAAEAAPAQEPSVEPAASAAPEADESTGSKAEIAREAVRKKIVVLLRHRLGKVPRKISQSLKDVSNTSQIDKLFEQALSVESLEDFEAALQV